MPTDAPTWEDTEAVPTWDDTTMENPPSLEPVTSIGGLKRPPLPYEKALAAQKVEFESPPEAPPPNPLEALTKPFVSLQDKLGVNANTLAAGVQAAVPVIGRTIGALTPEEAQALLAEKTEPPNLAEKIAAGAQQGVIGGVEALETPLGAATMGVGALPKVAQGAVSAGFSLQMASQIPSEAVATYKAIKANDPEAAARYAAGVVVSGVFTAGAAKGAVKSFRPNPEAEAMIQESAPQIQSAMKQAEPSSEQAKALQESAATPPAPPTPEEALKAVAAGEPMPEVVAQVPPEPRVVEDYVEPEPTETVVKGEEMATPKFEETQPAPAEVAAPSSPEEAAAPVAETETPPTPSEAEKTVQVHRGIKGNKDKTSGPTFWSESEKVANTYAKTDRSVGGSIKGGNPKVITKSITPSKPLDLTEVTENTPWENIRLKLIDSGIDEAWLDDTFDSYAPESRPGVSGILDDNWSPDASGLALKLKSLGFDFAKVKEDGQTGWVELSKPQKPTTPSPAAAKEPTDMTEFEWRKAVDAARRKAYGRGSKSAKAEGKAEIDRLTLGMGDDIASPVKGNRRLTYAEMKSKAEQPTPATATAEGKGETVAIPLGKTDWIAMYKAALDDPNVTYAWKKKANPIMRRLTTGFSSYDETKAFAENTLRPLFKEAGFDPPEKAMLEPTPAAPASEGKAMRPGPGHALPSELSEGTGGDIYGIAQRVREERARAGQVDLPQTGQGISAPDSVERGRTLLKLGKDPEAAVANFEKTQRLSADDMALVRAKGESLAYAARRIEEKFGTNSPEYSMAWKALSDWDARTKPMQTEWHKMGEAQQGETEIDTGTFTGLQRAFHNAYDKDFTPEQAERAKQHAKAVSDATEKADKAEKELFDTAENITDPVVKSLAERIKTQLDAAADKAIARIKARRAEGRLFSSVTLIPPEDLADYAIYGAAKLTKAGITQGQWAAEMVKEIGDFLKPEHLKQIWEAANKEVDDRVDKGVSPPKREAVKKSVRKQATPTTAADVSKLLESHESGQPFTLEQVKGVWKLAKRYIAQGDGFDDVRHKLATDLGMPVKDVTKAMTQPQSIKRLSDEVWKRNQEVRRVKQQAKRWLIVSETPGYQHYIGNIPRYLFGLKVGFHGTVALGTHAPMVAFQPRFWATYVKDFGTMYRMVKSATYYEEQVQDLVRRPNYIEARRAGLVNDPSVYEDYNSPDTVKYFANLTGMGNRGYTVLKILRQDMFDQHWDRLPDSVKTPEMAKSIADGVNHATGVIQGRAPKGTNLALFAPRLEASRVMWLAGDPAKAGLTFLNWKKATPAEKYFATQQVKEKAWVAGTALGLLALNQGVLSAIGSKQQINFDNPFASDWLKFKAAGMDFSYGNAMLTMAKLPVSLVRIRTKNAKKWVYPDEEAGTILFKYIRSQLSPFAGLATTLALGTDYQNRPLPNSNLPVPKRLRAEGVGPYTWPEFWTEELTPIPVQEMIKEVWKTGMGMSDKQVAQLDKALATIAIMTGTGGRVSDDVQPNKPGF